MKFFKRLPGREGPRDIAIALLLIALNGYIALNLLLAEYLSHMESIEAAYIGISRYILDHGFNLDWFPLWYCGVPFQNSYPPLLHALVAAVAGSLGISPAHAHHAAVGAIYSIAPVPLYFMAKRLSGDWRTGAAAALALSILSPSAFLSSTVRTWAGLLDPVRFLAIVQFGDGPHAASVALIPLAILAIHYALEGRSPLRIYFAALACAAVVLTNWLGAFGLALAVIGYLLARSALGLIGLRALLRAGAIGALAYGCAMPWIPPSTIARIQHNAQFVIGKYELTRSHLLYAAPLLAAAALTWWLLRRFRVPLLAGFACFLALFSSALVMAFDYLDVSLMPQPNRYHHEMDLAWSVALACGGAALFRRMNRRVAIGTLAALLALAFVQAKHTRRRARIVVGPVNIETTIEYKVAAWLRNNLPGRRAFLTGSAQFWLNAFSDTPQVGGGFGQGILNDQIPAVHFGVPWTTGNGGGTIKWLKLYGAAAVVVSEAGSRDAYPGNWRDPAKFHGLLEEGFREGGDVIYRVPLRSDSLAHVIPRGAAVRRSPVNSVDLEPVEPLVQALDDAALPLARMDCVRPGDCTIRAEVRPEHLVFVQITHHRGWRATVNGERRPIERDGLGFMLVDAGCSGPCEVRLEYDGGREMTLAKLISLASNGLGLIWLALAAARASGILS